MMVGRGGRLWLVRDRGAGIAGTPFGSLDEFDPVTEVFGPYPAGYGLPLTRAQRQVSTLLFRSIMEKSEMRESEASKVVIAAVDDDPSVRAWADGLIPIQFGLRLAL